MARTTSVSSRKMRVRRVRWRCGWPAKITRVATGARLHSRMEGREREAYEMPFIPIAEEGIDAGSNRLRAPIGEGRVIHPIENLPAAKFPRWYAKEVRTGI